jgi:hypothetical protein
MPKSTIQLIENSEKEEQFAKAVDMVKDAIPQTLRIRGHNPITLLYSETSQGIHELTDEQCLDRSHSIRIILSTFADRIHQAVRDEAELKNALKKIFNKQKKKSQSNSTKSKQKR